jgi:hypothetical protein
MEGFNVALFEAAKFPRYALAVSLLHTYAEHLVHKVSYWGEYGAVSPSIPEIGLLRGHHAEL